MLLIALHSDEQIYNRDTTRDTTMEERGVRRKSPALAFSLEEESWQLTTPACELAFSHWQLVVVLLIWVLCPMRHERDYGK